MHYVTIPGTPVGKPRMTRRDKWAQRDCVLKYRWWADKARDRVKSALGRLPDASEVKKLSWVAYFAPPKSWSKKRSREAIGELHRSRPDRDNLDKSVLDSLFREDSGVAAGTIEKRWDWVPRLELILELE